MNSDSEENDDADWTKPTREWLDSLVRESLRSGEKVDKKEWEDNDMKKFKDGIGFDLDFT